MRLELALMVGILFFCSWCAYIVARMNSSVASEPVEQQQQAAPTTWRHPINQSEYPHSHPSNAPGSQLEQQQQQHRIYQASEPPIRYQAPTALQQPPPPQQQLTSGWSQPQAQLKQYQAPWHAYALPTNQQQLPATPTPEFGPAPELLDDAAAPPDYDTSSARGQPGEPEVGGDSEPAASDDNEAEGDATAEGDDANATNGDADDEPETGDDDQLPVEGAPPTQTELDEVAQRRSFDEFQFDSNERDQNGRLVSTKRRHLVNGRPVAAPPAQWDGRRSGHLKPATRRTNYATASAAPHAGLPKLGRAGVATSRAAEVGRPPTSGEFERLVSEIDQEDKLNKRRQRHGDDSTKPEESQQRDRVVVAAAAAAEQLRKPPIKGDKRAVTQHPVGAVARAGALKSRIKPGSDLHEHRLSESLTQQQWDDDATTPSESSQSENSDDDSGETRTTNDNETSEQNDNADDAADDDQQVAKHDDEAQKLEGLAQDLMLDSKFAELTRRRREAANDDDDDDDEDHEEHDSQQSSGAVDLVLSNDMRALPGNSSRADKHGGRAIDHDGQDGELKADTVTLNSTSVASTKSPVPDAKTADNRPQVIRSEWGGNSAASDPVSGLEDMHIEVLAQPPPPLTNYSSRPEVASSVAQQQQQLGYFPRVASPFAAGSASEVSKRKKSKKKKYGKKKSKMEASKYKAASAYAKKHSSKQKKGQMRKKKRKSEKKLIAGKKHFAGSTRGYKKSRGHGLKGANKGATYLKDKGYKKRGFKKAYHKLETGDHKTYFDEFRDKDHKKKWKKYDDKHKYSQNKKWAGSDMKHMNHHDLKEARGKASKSAKWRAGHKSKWAKEANKYKKAKKMAQKSQVFKKKKKKRTKKKKEKQ